MLVPPIMHIEAIDRRDVNQLLVAWGHRMGAVNRPVYSFEAHHAMFQHGEPVAVTVTGETAREVVGSTGLFRTEVAELVRLCALRPGMCRPMLRIWREMIFPLIAARHRRSFAVSYQDEALHTGNLYRFDGWIFIGKGGGGGLDSRTGRSGRSMKIWGWAQTEADLDKLRALRRLTNKAA
ncbi:hypothetical protein [Aurantimonas sp. 22II-16-19i]|uniref:hypothetical protein n=1 Tax=Aurantimonas sp. 22II-16-19i TaxID=1317114 RepID=UPI0009F7E256|nr:hypothetical protein [Aurantimonas sp. 22II-16-19i]ORE90981.1 hypothetical protein ATO4_20004 [Aurantimonas sp. 22II-16-19i]